MPSNVFRWDELDILRKDAELYVISGAIKDSEKRKEFCDYFEWVMDLIYAYGWHDAEEIVGIVPFKDGLDDKAVNHLIDGKTFRDRITADSTYLDILRIIDTEAHWNYNTGVYDASVNSGVPGLKKRWNTMLDDRVRDTHDYMEGMVVGLHDLFYTYTGDSTMYPGGFGVPEEDINCRCWVTIER